MRSRLSDPYSDWDDETDRLEVIAAKAFEELDAKDYGVIFARNLPAADYPEGITYLEACFSYLRWVRSQDVSSYPDSVLWWCHHFRDRLAADGLLEKVLDDLLATLKEILSTFTLFSFSEQECRAKGRDHAYSVGPCDQQTVHDMIDDLTSFPLYDGVVDELFAWLSDFTVLDRARWFVEIAWHSRTWGLFYDPGDELDDYRRKEALFHRLHSFALLQPASQLARDAARGEGHSKYDRIVLLWA